MKRRVQKPSICSSEKLPAPCPTEAKRNNREQHGKGLHAAHPRNALTTPGIEVHDPCGHALIAHLFVCLLMGVPPVCYGTPFLLIIKTGLYMACSPPLQRKTWCRGAARRLGIHSSLTYFLCSPTSESSTPEYRRNVILCCQRPDSTLILATGANMLRGAKLRSSSLVARLEPDSPRPCQSRITMARTTRILILFYIREA